MVVAGVEYDLRSLVHPSWTWADLQEAIRILRDEYVRVKRERSTSMSSTNDKERLDSLRIDGLVLVFAFAGAERVFGYAKEVLAMLWQRADAWARLVDDCGGTAILEVDPIATALYLAVQDWREDEKARKEAKAS